MICTSKIIEKLKTKNKNLTYVKRVTDRRTKTIYSTILNNKHTKPVKYGGKKQNE